MSVLVKRLFIIFIGFFLAGASLHGEDYQFKGKHFIASYLECDEDALGNVDALRAALKEAANASGATILDGVDFSFTPQGFTMALLLSESHATIHTYPEHRACFVDLFTCGDHCSAKRFDAIMRGYLKPGKVNSCEMQRSEHLEIINLETTP